MKKLITLALIISITVISWSSCAKHTQINTNSLYNQSILVTPVLSNQLGNERYITMPNKTSNNHNFLFETTMIFNDKLQQLIAFFTGYRNNSKEVASNNVQNLNTNILDPQQCKENS